MVLKCELVCGDIVATIALVFVLFLECLVLSFLSSFLWDMVNWVGMVREWECKAGNDFC